MIGITASHHNPTTGLHATELLTEEMLTYKSKGVAHKVAKHATVMQWYRFHDVHCLTCDRYARPTEKRPSQCPHVKRMERLLFQIGDDKGAIETMAKPCGISERLGIDAGAVERCINDSQ